MAAVTASCCKSREVQSLTRHREFDAFVCYNFDTDREFDEDVTLTEYRKIMNLLSNYAFIVETLNLEFTSKKTLLKQ